MKKSQSPSKSGKLSAISADVGTEIFVMNSRFERVARGVNKLETTLDPGIYKVRFRSGVEMRDVLTEVMAGPTPTVVRMEPLEFASAAPIAQTSTTHEFQRDPAQVLSRASARPTNRSDLMLFVRDPKQDAGEVDLSAVEVRKADGSEIGAGVVISDRDRDKRYAGWNRPVEPGTYSVRVHTGAKGSYEMFVVACRGWQTLVFLVAEDFPHQRTTIRRPALRSASVLMCQSAKGFDANAPLHRLAEKAKAALHYARPTVWDGLVDELVRSKFSNPMLGIFGLHLGLLSNKPDGRQLTTVIKNLTGILSAHPDVDAARLDRRLPDSLRRRSMRFPTPPMLRSSWDLIVGATAKQPSLVPAGSRFDQVAEWQVPGGPWLLARVSDDATGSTVVDGRYARGRFKELRRIVNDPGHRRSLLDRVARPDALTPLQRNLLDAATAWADHDFPIGGSDKSLAIEHDPTLQELIARTRVPACTIARTATFLIEWASRNQ